MLKYHCPKLIVKRACPSDCEAVDGDWRNWLARTDGVREVDGSNPLSPTLIMDEKQGPL